MITSTATQPALTPRAAPAPTSRTNPSPRLFRFFVAVVVIQGVHVVEHIIQLIQVMVFDVPDDDAFGLLGYVVQFNDTEEWLHLGFNATYLAALYILVLTVDGMMAGAPLPRWAFRTFLIGGAGLETWHMTEHTVIIYNVIRNSGCPCPGIGDRALSVTDTQLHLVYNLIAYAATVLPFWFVMKARSRNRLA